MTIDKYTKFLLTMIAVGIIGINFHLFKGSIVKDAFAASSDDWQVVVRNKGLVIVRNHGKSLCYIRDWRVKDAWEENGTWVTNHGC
jgi:hypothetical protein